VFFGSRVPHHGALLTLHEPAPTSGPPRDMSYLLRESTRSKRPAESPQKTPQQAISRRVPP
jgi:hypothetical protein